MITAVRMSEILPASRRPAAAKSGVVRGTLKLRTTNSELQTCFGECLRGYAARHRQAGLQTGQLRGPTRSVGPSTESFGIRSSEFGILESPRITPLSEGTQSGRMRNIVT